VYIIKPEGMAHREVIRQMIELAGLVIVSSRLVVLPEEVMAELYPDLYHEQGEFWHATKERLAGEWCEVGIVEAEKAISKLLTICGEATDPRDCGPETIRARFGTKPYFRHGAFVYYQNVIHRSKNEREAATDLRIAHKLLTGFASS
jgi:nucleoside diphosphate kinase